MDEKKMKIMKEEPITQAILKLSIPMIMGMMVQVLYNLVDTYFIGMLGDANQLAAANIALPIFVLLMGMASIIGTGAASYISRCLGSKDYERANETLSLAVKLLFVMGIGVTVIGGIFCGPITRALGGIGEVYHYTYYYTLIMIIGGIGVMGNFAFGQLLRSEGSAIQSMMGMVIGTVLNIILDPIFIFVFDLGVVGAALATVIGNGVGLVYYIVCFVRGKTFLKIHFKGLKVDRGIVAEIIKIGLPSSLSQILMSIATIVANNIAIGYGAEVVAGMGVASKITMIGTFIFIGFSAGIQPLIGYNYGAKNNKRMKAVIKKAIQLTTGIGLVLLSILLMHTSLMISLFTIEEAVIEKGTIILRGLIWSLPFIGIQMITTATAQAMGKAIPAMILSVLRQGALYVPLLIVLNALFDFYGFVFAQPVTDFMMALISVCYLTVLFRGKKPLSLKVIKRCFDKHDSHNL